MQTDHDVTPAGSPADSRRRSVSILTPVLDEALHVRAAVKGMQDQDFDGDIEFIFIDGRSADRTREILEELAREEPRVRVLDNPARQTAVALNIGLRAGTGDYVARFDAHTVYPPHYLSRGIERLERGDVEWVSGPQVPIGIDKWSRRIAMALGTKVATGGTSRWAGDVAQGEGAPEVELGTGVFTGIWRRSTLERYGGWDEGWPINQDSELAARVLEAGGRIVSLPELAASYTPRSSLKALSRQYRRWGTYRAKTFLRHPKSMHPVKAGLPGLVCTLACALIGPRPLRPVARAGVGGYGVLVGIAAVQAARGDLKEAPGLIPVFVTMHLSWGVGFLGGLGRFAVAERRARATAH